MRVKQAVPIKNETRPLIVGGVRNEHGTRICRKITCGKCQKLDYVSVSRSKKGGPIYCRNCAKEEIRAYEKGTKIKSEMIEVICSQCSISFEFPKWIQKQGILLCSDCHHGFEVWRGSLETPIEERSAASISRRPAGTLLRNNRAKSYIWT